MFLDCVSLCTGPLRRGPHGVERRENTQSHCCSLRCAHGEHSSVTSGAVDEEVDYLGEGGAALGEHARVDLERARRRVAHEHVVGKRLQRTKHQRNERNVKVEVGVQVEVGVGAEMVMTVKSVGKVKQPENRTRTRR